MSMAQAWSDFWSRIYGFDGMFPRTLKDLTIKPGFVAREFIRGVRVRYYGPVGYFFLMVTLLLLLLSSLNLNFGEFVQETQKSFPLQQKESYLSKWVIEFVTNNLKLVLFLGIPFQGIAARYFLYRKSEFRFIEHMVLPFYLAGHIIWVTILIVLTKAIFNIWPSNFTGVIGFLFYGIGYISFATHQSKVKSFFKGMGVYAIGQLLFVLFIILVAIGTITYLAYFDREAFELIKPSHQ